MKTITQAQLDDLIDQHQKFIDGNGVRLTIIDTDLSGMHFSHSDLSGAVFKNCNMNDTEFMDTNLSFATMENVILDGAWFNDSVIDGLNFSGTDLSTVASFAGVTGTTGEVKAMHLAGKDVAYTRTHIQIEDYYLTIKEWKESNGDVDEDIAAWWNKAGEILIGIVEVSFD